jgi:ribosomal protein L22
VHQRKNKMVEEKTKKQSTTKKTNVESKKKEIVKEKILSKEEKPLIKEEIITEKKEESQKKEKKQKEKAKEIPKKEKACVNGYSLKISPKDSKAICKMIKHKSPENAIKLLEGVIQEKIPVKMTGLEVPHQRGKGIAGARFPKNASIAIKDIVKQLKANSIVAGIEDPIITLAISNKASSTRKSGGRQSKRTHIYLEAKDKTKLIKKIKK